MLQEARVPIISSEVCNSPDFYGNQIKPKMFCAGYPEGGIDACQVRGTGGGQPPEPTLQRRGQGNAPPLEPWGPPARCPIPPTRVTVAAHSYVRTASQGHQDGGSVAL